MTRGATAILAIDGAVTVASPPPTHVAETVSYYYNFGTATSYTVPVAAATTVGNKVVVAGLIGVVGTRITSVTDTKGNTWTVDVAGIDVGTVTCYSVSAPVTAALTTTDTITFNLSAGSAFNAVGNEFTNLGAFDVDGSLSTANVALPGTASVTLSAPTSGPNDVLVGVMGMSGSGSPSGMTSGFTLLVSDSSNWGCAFDYDIPGTSGTFTDTWTISGSGTVTPDVALFAYKGA